MLSIAICDDSSFMRAQTKKMLVNYSFKNNLDLQIHEYDSGEILLKDAEKGKSDYDLIFMDYEFEGKGRDGITIISELRKLKDDTRVIFLSSYSQVVFESFEVETFRFLVKPLDEGKLFKAMDDFQESMKNDAVLAVKIEGESFFYKESNITYVEGFGKNCIIHFDKDKKAVVCGETLAEIESRLSEVFYRCQKSYLVNLGHVESYNHSDIVLSTNESIQISRAKYKEFGSALTNYITSKRGF